MWLGAYENKLGGGPDRIHSHSGICGLVLIRINWQGYRTQWNMFTAFLLGSQSECKVIF